MDRGSEELHSLVRSDAAAADRHPSTLYEFVRQTLALRGGVCSRRELLAAIEADPLNSSRLARSRGFASLLQNMKHSGFVELQGDLVRRTKRRVGRRHL